MDDILKTINVVIGIFQISDYVYKSVKLIKKIKRH